VSDSAELPFTKQEQAQEARFEKNENTPSIAKVCPITPPAVSKTLPSSSQTEIP